VELQRSIAESTSPDFGPPRTRWKPLLWSVTQDGQELLIKDLRYCSFLYRFVVGRLLLRNEGRIYRRAAGLPFVPKCFGWLDGDALILEKVDAVSLGEYPSPRRRAQNPDAAGMPALHEQFFDRLTDCVSHLHQRGVVHMDLRHRSNIMVTPDGHPVLIDFETAIYLGTNRISRRLLMPLFARADYSAVMKFRLRYFPQQVSPENRRRYERMTRVRRILWPFGRIWPPPGFRAKSG